ncbi:hypothetical protein BG000_004074 [Podila horticola]|nr:hypothetical protein BG000_004074 [Podila horticola]
MQRTSNNKYSSKNNDFVTNPAYLNATSSHASQNSTTEAAGAVGAVAAGPAAAGNNVVNAANNLVSHHDAPAALWIALILTQLQTCLRSPHRFRR